MMHLNAKCNECGKDEWKHGVDGGVIVCAVCNPREGRGSASWPRIARAKLANGNGDFCLRIIDKRLKRGMEAAIHKEAWGYSVIVGKKKNSRASLLAFKRLKSKI